LYHFWSKGTKRNLYNAKFIIRWINKGLINNAQYQHSRVISDGLDYVSRSWNYRMPRTGAKRPSSPEPAASWSLSPGVEGYLWCACSGRRTGAPQRDSQVREVRIQATLAYLTEKSSSLLPRYLNGKQAMANQRRRKEEKESRVEKSKSHFEVASGCGRSFLFSELSPNWNFFLC